MFEYTLIVVLLLIAIATSWTALILARSLKATVNSALDVLKGLQGSKIIPTEKKE